MDHISPINYPFSAIIGQDRLKSALLLVTIDPRIGGVLISGPRGSAKSTLARGLADIGPYSNERFINLPLGVSEEKLIGSLDLRKVLNNGEVTFSPGLLYRAHGGVLYIDEVNLLADYLVDLLLDVAASGVNLVERDGISRSHAAEFVLIGTMNPDEGELRPQLLDRFGLCVPGGEDYPLQERAEIARRRLEFDDDPQEFVRCYQKQQTTLAQQIIEAQNRLKQISIADDQQAYVASKCQQEGVEGLRADITILRAARAHAAWHRRVDVSTQDIDDVAELVLVHRRQVKQAPAQHAGNEQHSTNAENQSDSHKLHQNSGVTPRSALVDTKNCVPEGDWGQMPPQAVPIGPVPTNPNNRPKKKVR